MKEMKLYISIMVVIGFLLSSHGIQAKEASADTDLMTLVSGIQGENIIINGWSLHAREKLEFVSNQAEIKKYVKTLQQQFSDWKWSAETDQNHWQSKAVLSRENREESITILSTLTNDNKETYLLYEVKGKDLDNKSKQFLKSELPEKLSDIFRGNATIFSCIKGEFNDNMETSLPNTVNKLLKAYKAKEIEGLKEKSFISISAYSPFFEESLFSSSHDINMQIGLRNEGLGSVTTFVVGTPIITIEY
ncbi:YwmB family TATA-box binding protein [Cytobacillus sp. Hz8]|uniref:YwmB family TATA-box binding protein n=1 Tax=Cytobacillus sp. Hz8 TaxID=3347168 RepID=UPI0035DD219C